MKMLLIRHGQTQGNAGQLLHGRTDLPLSDLGRLQAAAMGKRVHEEFQLDAIVSSPLKRAHETASQIAARFGLPIDIEPDLQEMDFGDLEGHTLAEVMARYPDLAARSLDPHSGDLRWPNGESRLEIQVRVTSAFERITTSFDGRCVAIVAHNGILGRYLAPLRNVSAEDWKAYGLTNCGISGVQMTPSGARLEFFNSITHLEGLLPETSEVRR